VLPSISALLLKLTDFVEDACFGLDVDHGQQSLLSR
jgi:hypothetical protein